MIMKNILVVAYAVSPYKGSEYAVGWNYIKYMSKYHRLTVVYGTSGNHLGDNEELTEYLKSNQLQNVKFEFVDTDFLINAVNFLNRKNIFVYTFYFAYSLWHRKLYRKVKVITSAEQFDLVHFLNPIGYREPGLLWKLNLPYIWGPVGGTQSIPLKMLKALSKSDVSKLLFRKYINYLQFRYKVRLKNALEETDVLIAATTFDQANFMKIHNKISYYLPENGIDTDLNREYVSFNSSDTLELIWVGRIDGRKALIILLDSLIKVKNKKSVHLNIVGDGPLLKKLKEYSKLNEIDSMISWHGMISRFEVFDKFKKCHLHIITSLTEANTTVIWEAMTANVPTLSLDHCGMHDTICEHSGFRIKINSYDQVVKDISETIDYLVDNAGIIEQMSKKVSNCAEKYHWDNRVAFFNEMYQKAISLHNE